MKTRKRANRRIKPRRRKLSSAKVNSPARPQQENLPAYSEDGVDLTLIRWMLSFTPAERLQIVQQSVQSIEEMRNASRGQ